MRTVYADAVVVEKSAVSEVAARGAGLAPRPAHQDPYYLEIPQLLNNDQKIIIK